VAIKKALKSIEYRVKDAFHQRVAPSAGRALRRAAERVNNIDDAVTLANEFRHWDLKIVPSQIRSEITGLLQRMAAQPPHTLLEIGTSIGGTFFLFTRVAAPDALLISLDLPFVRPGLGITPWRDDLYRSFARERQRIEILRDSSQQPATVERVKRLLGGRSLDFLFIDGDHSYAGVKRDFELYSPLVGPGGLIGFHDIAPCPPERRCGVPEFWQEIKRGRVFTEFVADWKQGAFGIGILG